MTELPRETRAVIISGGIVGCSTAYHLVHLGWDVVLLERGKLTRDDLGNAAFPFASVREVGAAGVPVLALRITDVGALGWELHVSTECAVGPVGGGLRVRPLNAGCRAIESLHLEKGYRAWGADIGYGYVRHAARVDRAYRLGGQYELEGAASGCLATCTWSRCTIRGWSG